MRKPFTDRALAELDLPEGKDRLLIWDTKQPGLGYRLGPEGGVYVVNVWRDGKQTRERLGSRTELTLPAARAAAKAVVGRILEGKDTPGMIRARARTGMTLADAIEDYLAAMRADGCRPTSLATVERELRTPATSYVASWLNHPLRSITALDCRTKHVAISTENGPYVANRVMKTFCALWNHIAREAAVADVTWPANPTVAVNYNATERRREPVAASNLAAWRAAVDQLENPVRRDYNLLVLFTGLRRMDAATIRWVHVNLGDSELDVQVWHVGKQRFDLAPLPARAMLRPSPKGGPSKAFVVPLSSVAIEILTRRKAENQGADDGWVFPARTLKALSCSICAELGMPAVHPIGVSHMSEPREDDPILVSPHRLRETYITAADESVPKTARKVLANHAWANDDVSDGYVRQELEHLRRCQELVTRNLLAKMGAGMDSAYLQSSV